MDFFGLAFYLSRAGRCVDWLPQGLWSHSLYRVGGMGCGHLWIIHGLGYIGFRISNVVRAGELTEVDSRQRLEKRYDNTGNWVYTGIHRIDIDLQMQTFIIPINSKGP